MKSFYIKQKVFSLHEHFTVKDEQEEDVYYVEGSFLKIPKTFTMTDSRKNQIAKITKKTFSFLPKFFVDIDGERAFMIRREFTLFKPRYTIDMADIRVSGNWLAMNFEVYQNGTMIARVNKAWFSWGDSYKVDVFDSGMEKRILALVIAIDCVKSDQNSAAAASV